MRKETDEDIPTKKHCTRYQRQGSTWIGTQIWLILSLIVGFFPWRRFDLVSAHPHPNYKMIISFLAL